MPIHLVGNPIRMILRLLRALPALILLGSPLPAQEAAAKRLASIVSVAVEEYAKAVDKNGKLISKEEFQETTDFLADARELAGKLQHKESARIQATIDTLIQVTSGHVVPEKVRAIHTRFAEALGPAGAIDLPPLAPDTVRGREVYEKACVSCHGVSGAGDGPTAMALPKCPPPIGDPRLSPDLTPTIAFHIVSVGVRGTPMAAFAGSLDVQQRWDVVRYIYKMRGEQMSLPVNAPTDATSVAAAQAARSVLALLDSALDFAKDGKKSEAGDRAFDAYLAFEPLETPARAKRPGLVTTMERYFADFKAAVRRSDMDGARGAREAIAENLPEIVKLSTPTEPGWGAFFQSFLIILREGFEAILVIGAVVAFLIKMGHRERLKSVWTGVGLGIAASAVTAVILHNIFASIPAGREIVEGITMLIAVAVLFSVSYWLISKVEAAKWQKFIRDKVTTALNQGGGTALAVVAFLAVYREGAETALFYQALFSQGSASIVPLILGMVVGGIALAIIFVLFYRFGVRIPMRPFFAATSFLLYLMAFIFMGKGIKELQEGNLVSITMIPGLPRVDALGIAPTVETMVGQLILVALFAFALVKTFAKKPASGKVETARTETIQPEAVERESVHT
jgi:high-affinity iron transporter